ncbi:hypothetical protein [Haloarcula onubensis]|uniref:Uncharacterized protein n=1 Tax=Haloarcula onubensis TaxID=2950539 RepID=A0ABU2FRQ9_9EURY|nr:hypothetical protein [Halomicroarcula sp. S3CR25-11]MDS0283455.1 hypothetical protein [Halomicroarcula sp. S3CR25-11]
MRYKVAPPARSLDFLRTARGTIPLVPDAEADCCGAIQRSTDVPDRETAREYLTFLQALGLVAESERGYHRTREDVDREALATAYRGQVFPVAELLDAVAAGADSTEAAFRAVREEIPRWERERDPEWERRWRERVDNLLGWAVVFDLVAVEDDRFTPAQ